MSEPNWAQLLDLDWESELVLIDSDWAAESARIDADGSREVRHGQGRPDVQPEAQ